MSQLEFIFLKKVGQFTFQGLSKPYQIKIVHCVYAPTPNYFNLVEFEKTLIMNIPRRVPLFEELRNRAEGLYERACCYSKFYEKLAKINSNLRFNLRCKHNNVLSIHLCSGHR